MPVAQQYAWNQQLNRSCCLISERLLKAAIAEKMGILTSSVYWYPTCALPRRGVLRFRRATERVKNRSPLARSRQDARHAASPRCTHHRRRPAHRAGTGARSRGSMAGELACTATARSTRRNGLPRRSRPRAQRLPCSGQIWPILRAVERPRSPVRRCARRPDVPHQQRLDVHLRRRDVAGPRRFGTPSSRSTSRRLCSWPKRFAAALPADVEGNVINIDRPARVEAHAAIFLLRRLEVGLVERHPHAGAGIGAPRSRQRHRPGPGARRAPTRPTRSSAGNARPRILRRGTTPEEIARAVRFILDAPAMTGQMIALDGGQHLAWETPDVKRAPRG